MANVRAGTKTRKRKKMKFNGKFIFIIQKYSKTENTRKHGKNGN